MGATLYDDLHLLRLHLETSWNLRLPALSHGTLDLDNNALLPGPLEEPRWRVYLAEVAGGRVLIWAPGIDTDERVSLAARAAAALAAPADAAGVAGVRREVALDRHVEPTPPSAANCQLARRLTSEDALLLEAFEPGCSVYYLAPHRVPTVGVEIAGRLVSVAHSSRRTSAACELGIDTLPAARRHGYALAAAQVWSELVAVEGLRLLYSASAENAPSLALAAAAGYRPYARAAYVLA